MLQMSRYARLLGIAAALLSATSGYSYAETEFSVSRCRHCDAVSRGGLAVGLHKHEGRWQLVVWHTLHPSKAPVEIALPKGRLWSGDMSINDSGLIVVRSFVSAEFCPVIVDVDRPDAVPKSLSVPDSAAVRAYDINNRGLIVGKLTREDEDATRAILWNAKKPQRGPTLLPTPKGRDSHASAINENGLIVGTIGVRAVAWNASELDRGPQFLASPEYSTAWACGTNSKNRIAGVIRVPYDSERVVVWDGRRPERAPIELPEVKGYERLFPLSGDAVVSACGVTADGNVVGEFAKYSREPPLLRTARFPIYWTRAHATSLSPVIRDFDSDSWRMRYRKVLAVEDTGQLVANYEDEEGRRQSYLLTPSSVTSAKELDGKE